MFNLSGQFRKFSASPQCANSVVKRSTPTNLSSFKRRLSRVLRPQYVRPFRVDDGNSLRRNISFWAGIQSRRRNRTIRPVMVLRVRNYCRAPYSISLPRRPLLIGRRPPTTRPKFAGSTPIVRANSRNPTLFIFCRAVLSSCCSCSELSRASRSKCVTADESLAMVVLLGFRWPSKTVATSRGDKSALARFRGRYSSSLAVERSLIIFVRRHIRFVPRWPRQDKVVPPTDWLPFRCARHGSHGGVSARQCRDPYNRHCDTWLPDVGGNDAVRLRRSSITTRARVTRYSGRSSADSSSEYRYRTATPL